MKFCYDVKDPIYFCDDDGILTAHSCENLEIPKRRRIAAEGPKQTFTKIIRSFIFIDICGVVISR